MEHYFVIEGSRETGTYSIYEGIDGNTSCEIHTVNDMKIGGLKECRQYIGNLLKNKYGYSLNQVVPHQCVKPGREASKNPWIKSSTVQDYLDGIDPLQKLAIKRKS